MTQPFVVSLKLTGDSGDAVRAVSSTSQAIDQLSAKAAQAAKASALAGRELAAAQSAAMRSRQAAINSALGIEGQSYGDRGADIAAYGRELDRLRALYVPAVAASQAYNRELDAINHAHRVGAINAQEQASAIAALDARYKSATVSAVGFRGAQGRGGNAGAFHTTNMMFQAQDIAMMTFAGQDPRMLAMQQGMQVAGIVQQIGNGKQAVQAMAGAVAGLLNPLNLAIIATIGLGSAAVQAFMNMGEETEDATTALERHTEWLDRTLAGYDKVREAADRAVEAAQRLPQGSVASELSARQADATERALAAMNRVMELQGQFEAYAGYAAAFNVPPETAASLSNLSDLIAEVTGDAQLSTHELDRLHTAFTELANNTADQNIRDIANEALVLIQHARDGAAEVRSLDDALRNLPPEVQIRIRMSQEFGTAIQNMGDLYMDPRSRFDAAREDLKFQYEQAIATADSYAKMTGAAAEYQRVLDSIDAAEAKANEKSGAKATRDAQKPFDQWKSANDNFQQRIDQQRLEIELLGQSTYEIERQRAAFDLLNQARAAGIPIDQTVNDQIQAMAHHYAAATVELERMREQQRLVDEQLQFYRSTFVGFFADMKAGLKEGQTFWESLGNAGANALDKIADKALGMAANGLFDMIFGAVMGGVTGGATGGAWGNGLWGSAIFNAKGNVYSSPALADYRNTIVDRPTLFAFAKGAGIMGEAGAEAIVPLTRTASGDLGVRMVGGAASAGAGGFTFAPTNYFHMPAGGGRAEFEAMLDERDRQLNEQFTSRVQDVLDNPRRYG